MIDTTYFGLPWQFLVILLKKLEIVKLLILGLTKTTLLDYPEKLAATIFTGGCNFMCPYCHNGHLVMGDLKSGYIDEETIFEFLNKRKNVLQGVCISGGEPTINQELPEFIKKIKDIGYQIKLDTNGTNPVMLSKLIEDRLIDYVAMDIKNTLDKYIQTTGCLNEQIKNVSKSVDLLLESDIDYEFRTTVVKELHTQSDIEDIYNWIKKCKKWYIQSYKESENVIKKGWTSYDEMALKDMVDSINGNNIYIRKS